MTALEFGLELTNIALSLDDESFKKIKPHLDKLEEGIIELIEERDKNNAK